MQPIYKPDRVFILLHSLIILFTGTDLALFSGHPALFIPAGAVLLLYLGLVLRRPLRRRRALRRPFPEGWREFLVRRSPFYSAFDKPGRDSFERDIRLCLADLRIEGIRRSPVNEDLRLLIAMGMATVLHGRPAWEPPVSTVLVYPGERFDGDYRIGRGNFVGQAPRRGPLIVTEASLEQGFSDPIDGFNVLYHELAHCFDWEDGFADGIPAARMMSSEVAGWKALLSREWLRVRNGRSILPDYAGTNEAELLAVACEYFFEAPGKLEEDMPEFYAAMKEFFHLDPVRIIRGAG
jgi:Mlc titration factor MtfA (ptsG expression regulator)